MHSNSNKLSFAAFHVRVIRRPLTSEALLRRNYLLGLGRRPKYKCDPKSEEAIMRDRRKS